MSEAEVNMKHYLVHDTLEAFLKSGEDIYFFGMTATGNIEKTVSQEKIRAGIGNKIVAVISNENEMNFSITTGLHYHEVYEIQSGQTFSEATLDIHDVVVDEYGDVTVTETEVTGDVLDFKADSFPKNHEVQLKTIVYDPDTNRIVADMYFIFKRALPDGALSEAFEAGNKTSDINFSAMADASGNYGKVVIVPRDY